MNWKYFAVSTVGTICLFLFLASVWHDMVPHIADLYLEAIVITPEGVR
jgi:hypothetical protein